MKVTTTLHVISNIIIEQGYHVCEKVLAQFVLGIYLVPYSFKVILT